MNAALESKEDIRDLLSEDTKMMFHHRRYGWRHRHWCSTRHCQA
jgi:hypothetical protein